MSPVPSLRATWVGERIRPLVQGPCRGRVLVRGPGFLHALCEGEILSLVAPRLGRGRRFVTLAGWPSSAPPPDTPLWRHGDGLRVGGLLVDLASARVYNPKPAQLRPDLPLPRAGRWLRDRVRLPRAPGSPQWPPCASLARDLVRLRWPAPKFQAALLGTLGLGPGLTPAGDDFLSGYYAARALAGTVSDEEREFVLRAAQSRTHPLSVALLHDSLWGTGAECQERFLAALGRETDADPWLQDVLGRGHSSGYWWLMGVRAALLYFQAHGTQPSAEGGRPRGVDVACDPGGVGHRVL